MASNNRNLYIAGTISCLTAALFGYSVGFIGGEIVLPSFLRHFGLAHLSAHELASARSLAVSSWIVGALVGVPMGMPICSRMGRKWCLLMAALLYVGGALMQVFSLSRISVFDVGRLINGMGVGAGTLVSPIYISEISPPVLRGILMSGYQVFVQAGALVGFWIAYVAQATLSDRSRLQWLIPISIQVLVGILLMLGCLIIPESPRYLAQIGRYKEMYEALAWLRRESVSSPQLTTEGFEIEAAAVRPSHIQSQSFLDELGRKDIRRRLAVGIGLMVAQNMVGLNALNYYAPVIFMSAGFTSISSSLFLTGTFGLVKLISSLTFMFKFVYIKGNRFWLLLGSTVCGASMLVLAYSVHALPPPNQSGQSSTTTLGLVSVLMVFVFAFAFGVSLGPISWNVCAEIFPPRCNSTCCAITTCTQWAFQIVIAAITPPLLATIGWATYLIFAGCCILTAIWVTWTVPETRGVGVGKPMDELFGVETLEDEEEAVEEVTEVTALLDHRRRRSSLAAYV